MKLVKIKPKLVDPQWFASKPVSKPIVVRHLSKQPNQPKLIKSNQTNFSFYYNLIAILILFGGAYLLYNRHRDKDEIDEKKKYEIGKFHRYVNENIST